tara:strand:- start:406 stop:591 length:186 start_codon:yes stop_codon:yes gene_type:complete
MKTLYNILAALVWIAIAIILFPILVFTVQLVIWICLMIAEILLFPFCILLVYFAYKATKAE